LWLLWLGHAVRDLNDDIKFNLILCREMRLLAIETSGDAGSVAAISDEQVLASADLDRDVRSGVSLAPAISTVLRTSEWQPRDVQLVAVTTGPGSFTGLRVGVTTARLFAYAVGAEVLGINTLEVIAEQAPAEIASVWTVVDAQRQQIFAGMFRGGRHANRQWDGQTLLLNNEEWLSRLTGEMAVTGPGLAQLAQKIPREVTIIDRDLWIPKAATVGRLAQQKHRSGMRDNLWTLTPQYYRLSAAEEKRSANSPK
jgi:tRNA threonylcarbamoyladenosine biosynthesis protein TsaB